MKLPYRENAIVDRRKITHYLLSLTHYMGKSKAKFFRGIGFDDTNIVNLEKSLLKIGKSNNVVKVDETKSQFAIKYVIDGRLTAPNGKFYTVRTVWAINVGTKEPQLITAHPHNPSV